MHASRRGCTRITVARRAIPRIRSSSSAGVDGMGLVASLMMYRPARQEGLEGDGGWWAQENAAANESRGSPLICIMERCIVIVSHSFYRSHPPSTSQLPPRPLAFSTRTTPTSSPFLPSTRPRERTIPPAIAWHRVATSVCLDLGGSAAQRVERRMFASFFFLFFPRRGNEPRTVRDRPRTHPPLEEGNDDALGGIFWYFSIDQSQVSGHCELRTDYGLN